MNTIFMTYAVPLAMATYGTQLCFMSPPAVVVGGDGRERAPRADQPRERTSPLSEGRGATCRKVEVRRPSRRYRSDVHAPSRWRVPPSEVALAAVVTLIMAADLGQSVNW